MDKEELFDGVDPFAQGHKASRERVNDMIAARGNPKARIQQTCKDVAAMLTGEKWEQYGNPAETHGLIAGLWNAYINEKKGHRIDGRDVACMMILMKVVRDLKGRKDDNLKDIMGYAALALE